MNLYLNRERINHNIKDLGNFKGKTVFIPKMPLIPSDTNLPFDFKRTQFPIRPAFCITINKSQGQTLEYVAIWLGDDHVFTHVIFKNYLHYKKFI